MGRKQIKHPIPENWEPPASSYALAEQHGQNVQLIEGIFRDYLASSGKQYIDYDAAFRNFIRNQSNFQRGGRNVAQATGPSNRGSIVDAAKRASARLQKEIEAGDGLFGDAFLGLPAK